MRNVIEQGAWARWLCEAANWMPDAELHTTAWLRQRPILMIGLGATGRVVLTQVATYLRSRCGSRWEERAPHIRLLQIGLDDQNAATLVSGIHSVNLTLNLEKQQRIAWHAGMDWCDPRRLGALGRSAGRLAIFVDLMAGKAQSSLWSAISASTAGLTDISVYLVADAFSNDGSGMIADIAHLVKVVSSANQIGQITLLLAGQHTLWNADLWSGPGTVPSRTLATLRELQRLQLRLPLRWNYAPNLGQPELDAVVDGPLLDTIFLFDGLGDEGLNLTQVKAEDGMLPSLANCLIALLDAQISQRFYEVHANQATIPARQGVPFEAVVGAMGAAFVRLPVGEMREVVAARLIHGLLFQETTGQLRQGTVADQDTLEQIAAPLRSMREELASRHLCLYLERRLNAPDSPGLTWVRDVVAYLQSAFPGWGGWLREIQTSLDCWASTAAGVPDYIDEIDNPDYLIQMLLASPQAGSLAEVWLGMWRRTRTTLRLAGTLPAHHAFWKLSDELRITASAPHVQRWVGQMQERVYWRWRSHHSGLRLELCVLPPALDMPDPRQPSRTLRERALDNSVSIAYTPERAAALITALALVAEPITREFLQHRFGEYLADDVDRFADDLDRGASPLVRRHHMNTDQWPIAAESFRYLAGPAEDSVRGLADRLRTKGIRDPFHFHSFVINDARECVLLHVTYSLLLYATDLYRDACIAAESNPNLYLWRAEQIAARWEAQANALEIAPGDPAIAQGSGPAFFSPLFANLLQHHERAALLLGVAVIYQGVTLDLTSLSVQSVADPMLQPLVRLSLMSAIEWFARDPSAYARLTAVVQARRQRLKEPQRTAYQRVFCRTIIRPLSQRETPDARDLALLLAAAWAEVQ